MTTRTAVPAAEDASPSTMPPDVAGLVAELRTLLRSTRRNNWLRVEEKRTITDAMLRVESLSTHCKALESLIAEHNKRCERECDSRLFGSLPRRYLIEVPK